jgi:hypothetical protein
MPILKPLISLGKMPIVHRAETKNKEGLFFSVETLNFPSRKK